jgi:MFS family permease
MLPDGKPLEKTTGPVPGDFDSGVKDALKMRAFWFIGIAGMLQGMAMISINIHIMPYLTDLGMERDIAAMAVMVFSILTLSARLPFGFLADIFQKRYVMAASLALTAIGLVIFGFNSSNSFTVVIFFAIFYGIGTAGAIPLRGAIIREYFGARRYGTIFGLMAIFMTIGSIAGAPLAAWVFDTYGTYNPIWLIYAGLSAAGTIMLLFMPRSSIQSDSAID